jgi:flagellar protein FliT
MMTNQEVLAMYQAMAELSGKMLEAAAAADWERLAQLEQRCAAHLQTLKDNEAPAPLQGASRLQKVASIKKILADDRKIRDLTMPWMAQLSALISSTGAERRLAKAYGAA